jgi:DegV family protein with EDD domain
MTSIAIITDSDSSLPASLAAQYGICQVPITIHFGEESFTTNVDIDDRSLFERIDREGKLPTTAAPSPDAFARAYRSAFEKGAESIICICVSSKVSGTYNSAVTACEDFAGRTISVVDSLNVSMGQGFMVLAAAEAIQSGASHKEALAAASVAGSRVHLYGSLTTLKYLAMSGRVGKIAAGVAGMLNIRPILTVREGKLDLLEKVRTRKAAMARLVELVANSVSGKSLQRAAIIHVNNLADTAQLEIDLRARLPMPENILVSEFTAGLAVHTGSGLVGVAIVTGE